MFSPRYSQTLSWAITYGEETLAAIFVVFGNLCLTFRRSRRRHPYRSLAWGVAGGYLIVASAYVVLGSLWFAAGHGHWSPGEAMLPRINDVIVFTFFAVCGGSVGSFINVVVWRMPQGLSVNGHSFCPRCHNRLRARDNVPVFGWLWLRGRCRDCRLPISSRYPIVEAAVAITFAMVGTLELYGWNLPYRPSPFYGAMSMPLISPESIVVVLYHLVGLAIAWAMGLIRYDGHSMPARLVVFASVWLIGGMMLLPSLAIVPWQLTLPDGWMHSALGRYHSGWGQQGGEHLQDASAFVDVLVRIATALVAAGFFARVLARAFCPRADLKIDPLSNQTQRLLDLVALISVPALLIGWQSVSGVLLLASVFAVIARRCFRPNRTDAFGRFALMMPVALAIQLLFWRPLMESRCWPSAPGPESASSRGVLLGFAMVTLLIPLWLRENPRDRIERPEPDDSGKEILAEAAATPPDQVN